MSFVVTANDIKHFILQVTHIVAVGKYIDIFASTMNMMLHGRRIADAILHGEARPFSNRGIPIERCLFLLESSVKSSFLYGSEAWTLSRLSISCITRYA